MLAAWSLPNSRETSSKSGSLVRGRGGGREESTERLNEEKMSGEAMNGAGAVKCKEVQGGEGRAPRRRFDSTQDAIRMRCGAEAGSARRDPASASWFRVGGVRSERAEGTQAPSARAGRAGGGWRGPWMRGWMHGGALCTLLLVAFGLAPQRAAAVGAAGCGSFYQDMSCREDCGSCGQPCCALEWEIALSATETRQRIMGRLFNASSDAVASVFPSPQTTATYASTKDLGFDGRFSLESVDPKQAGTLKPCRAQAVMGPSDKGVSNCVLIKGSHRPEGSRQHKHTDEISFAIFEISAGACRLKGFSRSRFITSHCDGGQNYQTLERAILALGLTSYVQTTLYGCALK